MTEKISYAIFKSFFPYNTPASAKRLYLSAEKVKSCGNWSPAISGMHKKKINIAS